MGTARRGGHRAPLSGGLTMPVTGVASPGAGLHSALMWLIDTLAEQRITEAMERGDLDDLACAGRPLVLDDDRHVPEALRAAFRVLKNSGYLPPELQLRHEINQVEQLLASVQDTDERARINQRLHYLMTRLGLCHGATADLRLEQAYYDKLSRKLERAE